ncbi:hypothetical protein ACSBR1_020736 [Camellia fascicularis]
MEDDVNLLPNYCPHEEKTFLSAPWANGITHVGQSFKGGVQDFRTILCKYAVECGFDFKYLKNDSVRITTVYSLCDSKGCDWFVHGRVLDANGFFYIRKRNSEHSCGVAVRTAKNRHLGSDLVSDIFSQHIRDKPLTKLTDVAFDLKKNYRLDISYRVAWLGVEKAKGEFFGAYSASFDQLRWYGKAVMEHNPGTYINIYCDEHDNRFQRYFISFKACIDGFKHCHPLLFLDGTFLKGRFKGNLLAAIIKDGNREYGWKIHQIRKGNRDQIPPRSPSQHWANTYFRGNRYGEMCSNAAESFNNWISTARHLPIIRLVDSIRTQIMRKMSARRDASNKWSGVICPKMEK